MKKMPEIELNRMKPKDGILCLERLELISANDSICILTGVLLVCRNWFITDKNVDGFILAS